MIPPYRETTGIVKFQVGSTGCGPLGEIQITKGFDPSRGWIHTLWKRSGKQKW